MSGSNDQFAKSAGEPRTRLPHSFPASRDLGEKQPLERTSRPVHCKQDSVDNIDEQIRSFFARG